MSLRTVQVWVARAGNERLDRVNWNDRPRGGRRAAQATSPSVEDLILDVRRRLKAGSALGEFERSDTPGEKGACCCAS